MSIQDLGAIGDLIGSIAVIISLVYLAIQVRDNTRATRTSTYHSIVSGFGDINIAMASTKELSSLFVRGMEDYGTCSEDEKARLSQLFYMVFRNFENMYYQHRNGHMEDEVWTGWMRLMLTYVNRPGFQQWWHYRRPVFSPAFVKFLDTTEIDVPIATYHDLTRPKH